jgi:glycosyltransferase involved in cell wall biosynthesis
VGAGSRLGGWRPRRQGPTGLSRRAKPGKGGPSAAACGPRGSAALRQWRHRTGDVLRPGALPCEDLYVDVLDTRGFDANPLHSRAPLLRSCGRLIVLAVRGDVDVDVVHVNISSHGSALRKGVVVRTCRLARLPVILHLHASSFPEFFDPSPSWVQWWVRRTFTMASRGIVLSETWRTYAHEVLAVPPDRTTVLPNAARRSSSPTTGRRACPVRRILFLGRLGERKGLPELLTALGRRSPAGPRLAGDRGRRRRHRVLPRSRERAGPGRARHLSRLGYRGCRRRIVDRRDVLVMPSHA